MFRQNPMGSPANRGKGTHGTWPGLMVEARGGREDLEDDGEVVMEFRPCSLAEGLARPMNPSPEKGKNSQQSK